MAEHFKLDITNRSVRITVWNNVSENFAEEYSLALSGAKEEDSKPIDFDSLSPEMQSVFEQKIDDDEDAPPKASLKPSKPERKKVKPTDEFASEFSRKYAAYNYKKRLKQRSATFRTDAYMNFRIPDVQFVTLTFDPKKVDRANDLQVCHHAFKKFIQRIHYTFKDFVYIATFSRQRNGNWHYHMLCNLDVNEKNKTIQDMWTYGMTHSTPLTSHSEFDARISYCIDNMFAVAWDDLHGEKGYLTSRGLIKPITLRSWKENEVDSAFKYLSDILESTDKPLYVSKGTIPSYDKQTEDINISYMISHKVFHELFSDVKVAKRKRK